MPDKARYSRAAFSTHPGMVRSTNQDCALLPPPGLLEDLQTALGDLYAVADGVGGQACGERASALAVSTVAAAYYAETSAENPLDSSEIAILIHVAMQEANQAVASGRLQDAACENMATTLTAAVVCRSKLVVGHVGDSRAYHLHDGRLLVITEDHTWSADLVRRGSLWPAEAQGHPFSHVLSRAIGKAESLEIDIVERDLAPGDRILICSDGLTRLLSDVEIESIAIQDDLDRSVGIMVQTANERGAPDNVTVILIEPTVD